MTGFKNRLAVVVAALTGSWPLVAQVAQVDLNYDGRQESEVHAPGYTSWIISSGSSASFTTSGVTFEFVGTGFSSSWYKAGVQSPNFARLANDGLVAGEVTLHISGLPAGAHSLLTFHNSFGNPENNTYANMEVFVNDELVHDELAPSNRVLNDTDAATAYTGFSVSDGESVAIRFRPEPASEASDTYVYINGFELNTADAARQSANPFPADMDEHANADDGQIHLRWQAAPGALSHQLYVARQEEELFTAGTGSSSFITTQQDTAYLLPIADWDNYYWRVDEVYAEDTVRGDVWHFRPRHLAFPGAEGYGRFAIGGRGGTVVHVTNLNDSGAGSLREAVTNDVGPRTIVFDVSGLIVLESRLSLKADYVTVAGQTAPGKGICIKSAPFGMSGAGDAIFQNLRVRLGSGRTFDGMGMSGSNHCIIDHCSISWTIDESVSSRNGLNISFQRNIISEPLNIAGHQNYPDGSAHGFAASISGDVGSFHHNLLAHSYGRNWSLAGGLDGNGIYAGRLDISNNVVYNFGKRTTDGGAHEVNFVNNYYKPGPGHQDNNYALNAQYDNFPGTQRYYFAGNVMPGYFDESNQTSGRRYSGNPQGYSPWVEEPFFPHEITLQTAYEAYKDVVSDAGCISPVPDEHDQRIIRETIEGSYTYVGSRSGIQGMPDSHEDVGGWEEYPEWTRPEDWDTDQDGLPNWWETIQGLSVDTPDQNNDPNADGYTNLEEYLHWLNRPHYFLAEDADMTLDLSLYTKGYQNGSVYTIESAHNLTVTVSNGQAEIVPTQAGLAALVYRVIDAEGSSKQVQVNFAVGEMLLVQPEEEEEEETVLEVDKVQDTVVFPNPIHGQLTIKSGHQLQEVRVVNGTGQTVARFANINRNSLEISAETFERGIHYLVIVGEGFTKRIKIIK